MGVNATHPLENPNAFTNLIEMISILLIPAALCFTFGSAVKNKKQGTNKLAALIFFIACCCLLFGKVTFREAAAMFAGSFCIFVLPYAAERILERISDFNRLVKDWVRG